MRLGVDVGGTFTDLVILTDGKLLLRKVSSTPADPSQAVLQGVEEESVRLPDVELFAHGTTVPTNAVIQRSGAPAGLLTTKGFRDVLQIRRTTRGSLYDFQWDPPPELVPREWRREVRERVDASGSVTERPDLEEAVRETAQLIGEGVKSLAICFINAYLNGSNEREIRAAVNAAFPDIPVYISSEILPEWREFERTSTAVVSAYVGPVLTVYLRNLQAQLRQRGYRYDLMVMLSNGGLATVERAIATPAYTLGSGPAAGVMAQLALSAGAAAGVMAQVAIAEATGIDNIIGMDIGGTSTDISLVRGKTPFLKSEFDLEFGTTVAYPVIDINSIGAGGGTIAWVDRGGMLHSGPQSAGAVPGPACMQRGGTRPTLTDANVVLHRLNPRHLLAGQVPVSEEVARETVGRLGAVLDMTPEEMAQGMLALTVSNIVHAVRQHTIERGLDPREFALMAYGGAGPLHAVEVASELGAPVILVPRHPGVTSALGLLLTDIRHDFVRTYLELSHVADPDELVRAFGELEERGRRLLGGEGVPVDRMAFLHSMDLRYLGQTHELTVPLPGRYSDDLHHRLSSIFRDAHLREYGHAPESDEPIEVVNLRVACLGRMERPEFPKLAPGVGASPLGERPVYFRGEWVVTPVYDRDALGGGDRIAGPAVVEQYDSTTIIPVGWRGRVDEIGNLILTRG